MGLDHGTKPITDAFVAIGWPAVGDLSKVEPTREAFREAVATAQSGLKPGAVPVVAGTLFRFTNELQQGDLIVFPSKMDRMIYLGSVESAYQYSPNAHPKFPNRRRVRWLRRFPRAHFSQAALNEIGSAITLFRVVNNAKEFLAALKDTSFEAVAVDEATLEATSENTEETTKDFIIKRLKTAIGPYQFEEFIARLLECMGYHARVTQKSGDGGVDVIASKDRLGFEPPILKVQCKQMLGNVGQPDVAQLYGHVADREHGLFVTLGGYTSQARQFERSKHNLRLLDGSDLVDMIFEHYEAFEPAYQMLLPLRRIYIPRTVGKSAGDE